MEKVCFRIYKNLLFVARPSGTRSNLTSRNFQGSTNPLRMRLIKANTSVYMHKLLSMLLSDFWNFSAFFSEFFYKNVMSLSWLKSLIFLHPICKFRARLEQCSRLVRILFEVNIISIYYWYIFWALVRFSFSGLPFSLYKFTNQ